MANESASTKCLPKRAIEEIGGKIRAPTLENCKARNIASEWMTIIDHAGPHDIFTCSSVNECRHRGNYRGVDYCSEKLLVEPGLMSMNVTLRNRQVTATMTGLDFRKRGKEGQDKRRDCMLNQYSARDKLASARECATDAFKAGITPDWLKKYEKYSRDMSDKALPFLRRKAAARFVGLNFAYAQEYYREHGRLEKEAVKSRGIAPLAEPAFA